MNVQTLLPHPALQPYIHHYVWIDTGKLQAAETIEQLPSLIEPALTISRISIATSKKWCIKLPSTFGRD